MQAVDPELFTRSQAGDMAAREQLVRHFMPLAKRVARASDSRLVEYEDLEQVASLALVLAIDRFDPARGLAFSTFAVPTISGEIKRYFRDRSWSVRVPRSLQENALRVGKVASEHFSAEGHPATPRRLAELSGLSIEEVLEALEANGAVAAISLDAGGSDSDGDIAPMLERLGATDPGYGQADELASIGPSLRALPDRERLVLFLRFVKDMTQSEIAAEIGVSQMHVSRILRSTLARLRAQNGDEAELAGAGSGSAGHP
jgi:RNA polymerase sigma-B factor